MEMHQLRYFAKVAELGNVTRAAEACHVSQPSLSQQIVKLERELGQPLLERLGRGMRLTEVGRLFRRYADQILSLTAVLTVLEPVRLGLGVSLIPAMAIPKGRDHGRVYRSLGGDKPSRTVALAWNRMHYQTQLFKRFVQFLSEPSR